MKKYFVFIVVFFLIGGMSAQAQLKFGLKAGVNLSSVSLKYGDGLNEALKNLEVENLTGFQVGPMLEFTLPVLGVGFDLAVLYSQQGFKLPSSVDQVKAEYKLNTLEIPVNLKYKLSILNLAGVFATAGPYANFRLSDDLIGQAKSKSFGAGLNLGLGVELLGHLQVGFNYKIGLTEDFQNIENNLAAPGTYLNGKPKGWSITAAYLF